VKRGEKIEKRRNSSLSERGLRIGILQEKRKSTQNKGVREDKRRIATDSGGRQVY